MTDRLTRLKTLLSVQTSLKARHEMRHASYLAQAAAAEREIDALFNRPTDETSLSLLFPDVYARHADRLRARAESARAAAEAEAQQVASHTVRADAVRRAVEQERRQVERKQVERDVLDAVERMIPRR